MRQEKRCERGENVKCASETSKYLNSCEGDKLWRVVEKKKTKRKSGYKNIGNLYKI